MANPCGTRTPCPDSFWNISPSEAFLPPTSGTSSMPNSSKKRTYRDVLIICPLVAHQALRYGVLPHTAPQLPTSHGGTHGARAEGHSNGEEWPAGKRGPWPLPLGLKLRQTRGGVQRWRNRTTLLSRRHHGDPGGRERLRSGRPELLPRGGRTTDGRYHRRRDRGGERRHGQ